MTAPRYFAIDSIIFLHNILSLSQCANWKDLGNHQAEVGWEWDHEPQLPEAYHQEDIEGIKEVNIYNLIPINCLSHVIIVCFSFYKNRFKSPEYFVLNLYVGLGRSGSWMWFCKLMSLNIVYIRIYNVPLDIII